MTGGVTVDVRPAQDSPAIRMALLHGLGSSVTVWDPLRSALPSDVESWAFAFPWDSGQGPGWAMEPDTRVWLEHAWAAAPGRPDIVVAHSFGANVLLDWVSRQGTAGCRGVVLMSPFYRPDPDMFDWAAIKHYLNDFEDLVRAGILARLNGSRPATDVLEAMVSKVRDRIGPYGWMRFFDLYTRTPLLDLSAVDVPCLVLGGGHDTAAYPHDVRGLADALPDAVAHILPDSGHFSMIDNTARVADLLRGFLHRLGDPTAAAKGAVI
ncbi:MAG TPA: alpha/beta hydrolase [Micromonosporaceae bacterium]